ncbi:MAG: hypothetical protein H7A37_00705 [Chlamydiales bacterium]|nr:hypothetical protein [Chlamydiia bacterium]MCP5506812.1 hypothetical protein [Chlamydiales bacterium]
MLNLYNTLHKVYMHHQPNASSLSSRFSTNNKSTVQAAKRLGTGSKSASTDFRSFHEGNVKKIANGYPLSSRKSLKINSAENAGSSAFKDAKVKTSWLSHTLPGYFAFNIFLNTGLHTKMHEVLGHQYFGYKPLDIDYRSAKWYSSHHDTFKGDLANRRITRLLSYPLFPRSGFGGISFDFVNPTKLGKLLGNEGCRAWVSFSAPALDAMRISACLPLGIYLAVSAKEEEKGKKLIGSNLMLFGAMDYKLHFDYHTSHFSLTKKGCERLFLALQGHDMLGVTLEASKWLRLPVAITTIAARSLVIIPPLYLAKKASELGSLAK